MYMQNVKVVGGFKSFDSSCDSQATVHPTGGYSNGGEGCWGGSEGEGEKDLGFYCLLRSFFKRSEPGLWRTGRTPGGLGGRSKEWE